MIKINPKTPPTVPLQHAGSPITHEGSPFTEDDWYSPNPPSPTTGIFYPVILPTDTLEIDKITQTTKVFFKST